MNIADGSFLNFSTSPSVRIIADTCSDLTLDMAREYGVDLVEFPYIYDGMDCLDDLFQTRSAKEFYDGMRQGARVMTSAVPMGRYAKVFEECAREGIPTICYCLTEGLSSSVRAAEQAAEMIRGEHPGFEIHVVDNRLPALCASFLVEDAARKRDEGATASQIVEWSKEACNFVHGYFTLESLHWLALGGRIPKAAAKLGSKLDVKANLTFDLDGSLTLTGMNRGRKKALKGLIKKTAENLVIDPAAPWHEIRLVNADCDEDIESLKVMLAEELGSDCPPIRVLTLDPTIGGHVGPGMCAVAFWGKDRRQDSDRGKR